MNGTSCTAKPRNGLVLVASAENVTWCARSVGISDGSWPVGAVVVNLSPLLSVPVISRAAELDVLDLVLDDTVVESRVRQLLAGIRLEDQLVNDHDDK